MGFDFSFFFVSRTAVRSGDRVADPFLPPSVLAAVNTKLQPACQIELSLFDETRVPRNGFKQEAAITSLCLVATIREYVVTFFKNGK
jgi:hypothetical protein